MKIIAKKIAAALAGLFFLGALTLFVVIRRGSPDLENLYFDYSCTGGETGRFLPGGVVEYSASFQLANRGDNAEEEAAHHRGKGFFLKVGNRLWIFFTEQSLGNYDLKLLSLSGIKGPIYETSENPLEECGLIIGSSLSEINKYFSGLRK